MKIFIRKYLLLGVGVSLSHAVLFLACNFNMQSLVYLLLYFYLIRFLDDYHDYFKDVRDNKDFLSRKTLLIGIVLLVLFSGVFVFLSKGYIFLVLMAMLLINYFCLKAKCLNSFYAFLIMIFLFHYNDNLSVASAFILLLSIALSIVYSLTKKKPQIPHSDLIGNKAYNLYFYDMDNTPNFFVVDTNFFENQNKTQAVNDLKSKINKFCMSNKKYAVRSSGVDEDSKGNSFAGIHDSFLNVTKDNVYNAILDVHKSAFSKRALDYRKLNNLPVDNIKIAVIIQEMVDSDYAGVINTINPVTDNADEQYISVCKGLGDKLVNGNIDSIDYVIKDQKMTGDNDLLSEKAKRNLIKFTNTLISKADCFLDIEFAIKNNKVYFLQARPITKYQDINPQKRTLIIDNSNIIESYYGETSQLTYSFASSVYTKVYTKTLEVGKVRNKILANLEPSLNKMLHYYHHKIYYNLNSWYHVTSIFPSKNSTKYMEKMMGVNSSAKDVKKLKLNIIDILKIGGIFLSKLKNIDELSQKFINKFNQVVLPYYGKKIELSNDELIKLFEKIENEIVIEFTTPIINDCAVMFYYGRLESKINKSKLKNKQEVLLNALSNHGSVESAKVSTYLNNLIKEINADKELYQDFKLLEPVALMEKYYQKQSQISKLIDEYLYRFGSRVINELKLETITMIENPLIIFEKLKESIDTVDKDITFSQVEIPKKYAKLANKTKKFIKNRESLRLRRTYVFSVVRNIFLAFASNFYNDNLIDDERDIFYLTKQEIFNYKSHNLRKIISLRKQENYQNEEYCKRVSFYGDKALAVKATATNGDLKGIGSGSGIVRAKVCLLNSASDKLIKNQIILTKRTDPGWVSLFHNATGLIVEHGSVLSHSFIVARELNLPAVVGVSNATSIIKDQQLVTLDGIKGVIKIED